MARERESFRDQLQSLQAKFPEQEVLTKDQACKLLGLDWDALLHIIPIIPLARWMVTW